MHGLLQREWSRTINICLQMIRITLLGQSLPWLWWWLWGLNDDWDGGEILDGDKTSLNKGGEWQSHILRVRALPQMAHGEGEDEEGGSRWKWYSPLLRLKYILSNKISMIMTGLHKLWYPSIRDRSTWSKFGEHGDVFLFSNLAALWFSKNFIRYSLHVCLMEVKNNLFSFKHSYLRHFSWRF